MLVYKIRHIKTGLFVNGGTGSIILHKDKWEINPKNFSKHGRTFSNAAHVREHFLAYKNYLPTKKNGKTLVEFYMNETEVVSYEIKELEVISSELVFHNYVKLWKKISEKNKHLSVLNMRSEDEDVAFLTKEFLRREYGEAKLETNT